jgi:hypothetical protein
VGLETTRQELEAVQEAVNQLSSNDAMSQLRIEEQSNENQSPHPEAELQEEHTVAPEEISAKGSEEPVIEAIECATDTKQNEAENKDGKQA